MTRLSRSAAFAAALFLAGPARAADPKAADKKAPAPPAAAPAEKTLSEALQGLTFRSIGPFRGGRSVAVAGVPSQPLTFYFGGTGGGIWKTVDGGANWDPVSDKDLKTGSVGALAVSESDPNVLYAGMGEGCIRGNVSHGDGVYKSTDAGKSWKNVGLGTTRQIPRVRIHPANPDLVYVAALGHTFGPNEDRGIFRSEDGGKAWKKVLYVDDKTGASDLVMDPANPRVLYAGFWQVHRRPFELVSGGTGSGLWKTTDGGDTWKKLAGGLPEGVVGRIGVAVSPARPERVWAIVESAEKGGVYRTEDGGEKWTRVNDENKLRQRAWYYTHIYADPKNPEAVYVLNTGFYRSNDGGKTYNSIRVPHGDNHDLWIDPNEPNRMIESNDGGANVSFNGGRSWSTVYNQPTAQFYRVITDDRFPYWVYGAQQDNTTVAIPSRVRGFGIQQSDWHTVGGCESGWVAPKPSDPDVVYSGCYGGAISRYDHRTGEDRDVVAWPQLAIGQAPKDLKYRFQWNAPILVSRHDKKTVLHAAQVLLRSRDEGVTWEEASPDLTRNDKTKQGYSGGPITYDNTGVEVWDTIFAVAESPHDPNTMWAGSDDGLIHVTRDGAKTWQNVTPKGMPEWIQVNSIDVSAHDAATAYVAATMYKWDDLKPYLYKTNDYGKTWTKIVNGIPDGALTRVVREDPVRRGLLYSGTETGLYVSFDNGARWQPFQRNLPVVPVTDLAVKGDDLVVATQGRSFWILDDVAALRQWAETIAAKDVFLFPPSPAIRSELGGPWWAEAEGPSRGMGKNPPNGVFVYYWLKDKPEAPKAEAKPEAKDEENGGKDAKKPAHIVMIEILDGDKVIRSFTSEKKGDDASPDDDAERALEPKQGLNRFVWDTRMLKPSLVPKAIIWGDRSGPKVAPGTYKVRLKKGEAVLTESFEVRVNPALQVSPLDLKKQADLLAAVRDSLSDTHQAVVQIRDVKAQAKDLAARAAKLGKAEPLGAKAKALSEKLTAIEEKLVNPKVKASQDVLNFPPRLDHQFVGVASVVSSADAAPAPSAFAYYGELKGTLDGLLTELKTVFDKDLADFNQAVRDQGIPPVAVIPKEPPKK